MFKKLGDLIHRTPWWGLLAGGLCVLIGLALFAIPIHVLRLSDHAKTPEERSAIKREINLAFGDRALHMAESVVGTMRSRASDPERRRELDQALAEMARARKELTAAQDASGPTIESAHETAQSALETAVGAAESALESSIEAREALQEARNDALAKLRERGIDTQQIAQSFEALLKSARESEATARESLAALGKLRPAPSTASSDPAARPAKKPSRVSIDLDLSRAGAGGADLLPQDVKNDIRRKVAGDVWRVGVGSVLILLFIPIFIMLVIAKYFIGRSRRALAFAEEKKQEAMVSDVNRQITEARLQALQAQVEPHFLYNTLANVQALTETDPPAANAMVGHLIQYLRAALPKMRENTSTIGQEIELVTAYLNVLKMRMGVRLEFGIDVPAELMSQPFPPMMLPSLVENAIKHGLEPLREGGRIDVVARRITTADGGRIQLQVRDTGRGLSDSPETAGGGVGLANLRERLTALYGGAGRFTLESNAPRGVLATIDIPAGIAAMRDIGDAPKAAAAAEAQTADPRPAEPPPTAWRRALLATSRTHGIWAWLASRIFLGLMTILAVVFLIALVSVYGGWLPINIAGVELDGIEGMAFGSIVLLVGFAACALAIAVGVAVFYGLGFLVAFLVLAIPVVILVSLFPVLAPFILIGFIVYWFWWRKRKQALPQQAKIDG